MWLLLALPSVGAVVLLLTGKRSDPWGHLLGCATVLTSFAVGQRYSSKCLAVAANPARSNRPCSRGCRLESCGSISDYSWISCQCALCC
ncbi:NADH-quinone oxidoreductase, L subunit domain protein [Mycobacterium xenopi 3993]|nr:NADH-quinone oxidoreductase, L subunit domain protein [Mycobacterium xenopi 3993]